MSIRGFAGVPSAIFLDRDGTLNAMVLNSEGQQDSPRFAKDLFLYPSLGELLRPFGERSIPLFVVTNQPGMAKGYYRREDLDSLHGELEQRMAKEGIFFRKIAFCPHHPVGAEGGDTSLIRECECRKPKPGMLLALAREFQIDLNRAVMVGDQFADRGAADAANLGLSLTVRTFIHDSVPNSKRKYGYADAPNLAQVLNQLQRELL